jgi:hypothetical protein
VSSAAATDSRTRAPLIELVLSYSPFCVNAAWSQKVGRACFDFARVSDWRTPRSRWAQAVGGSGPLAHLA